LPAPPPQPAAEGAPAIAAPTKASAHAKRRTSVKLAQATEELPAGAAPQDAAQPLLTAPANAAIGGAAGAAADATTGPIVNADSPWLGTPCPTATTVALPPCIPNEGPVLSHTKLYRGNDADVTEALEGYVYFRDDNRFGGWRSYLSRSDDFTRFCCHMHISEMLSARGGSRKTEVVWRWPESR
jgi:hypothetical protein